jgi:putative ABC transport system permease protein
MANLAAVDSGFETSRVATMSVTAVQGDWAAFHTRALERVSALPGVERAAFAWGVPLTGNNWPGAVEFEGATPAAAAAQVQLPVRSVTSGYFAVLGQTITDGRDVRATDIQGTPLVAVVNRALVDRYFAGRSPLGRKVWLRGRGQPPSEIVGVVSNGRTDDLTEDAAPEIYLSLWQATAFSKHLVVRTVQDPLAVVADVQRELRAVDPTAAVENVRTLDEIRGESLATQTFAMRLLVGFAVVATVLTLGGIYGVLSLSVAARRREIAIRSAVGAHRSTIVGSVLGEGLRLVAAGVTAGTVIAVAVTRMLQALLFEVGPSDPLTLFGAALSFTLVALLACAVPAARAMTVEPAEALRND